MLVHKKFKLIREKKEILQVSQNMIYTLLFLIYIYIYIYIRERERERERERVE